jgi:DNA-binding NtrC family response regulator
MRKRVLYIDDEADTEKMDSSFDALRREGLEIQTVTSVGDVIPTLEKDGADIGAIVVDIIMPPEDFYDQEETMGGTNTGLRLLKDVRRVAPDLPIVVVSIRRRAGLLEAARGYGVTEFLEKPIDEDELARVLRRVLGGT